MELSIGEAVILTRDREKWRSLVETLSSANGWPKKEKKKKKRYSSMLVKHSYMAAIQNWFLMFNLLMASKTFPVKLLVFFRNYYNLCVTSTGYQKSNYM